MDEGARKRSDSLNQNGAKAPENIIDSGSNSMKSSPFNTSM
jgi:hypothetical protein